MDEIEKVLLTGDLATLSEEQRVTYYKQVCEALGLNQLTQPLGYITFEGRLQLYAKKDATDQLRKKHKVSITELTNDDKDGVIVRVVKALIHTTGRTDIATGAVATTYVTQGGVVKNLTGNALANAIMKAETKAKRRVTLSICGLGILDESEVEDMTAPPPPNGNDIIKRNMAMAAANVGSGSGGIHAGTATELADTVVHIGKAEGNMLGKKVRELHDNVLEWLYTKWRDRLTPNATDQDFQLKKAVEAEWEKRRPASVAAQAAPEPLPASQDSAPNRAVMLDALREYIEDLAITPKVFMGYLQLAGFNTEEKTIEKLTDGQLQYLTTNWGQTKETIEAAMKPPVEEEKPKKKVRGKL